MKKNIVARINQNLENGEKHRYSRITTRLLCICVAVCIFIEMVSPVFAASGVDFGEYITGVSVSKLEGGSWVNTSEVTDGDSVKVAINYTLPSNLITADNRTIYYQLPVGIVPKEQQSGTVYNGSGVAIGTYTISPDGLVEIVFNNAHIEEESFSGTVMFAGTASLNGGAEPLTATFGGAGGSITIQPKAAETDLSVGKTGTLSADKKSVNYVVTASTVNGTDDTVTVSDALSFTGGVTGTYNQSSFAIYHVSASGARTAVSGYTPTFSGSGFTISGLPALTAGQSYEIGYTADMTLTQGSNGYAVVNNSASGTSGTDSSNKWNSVTVSQEMISKRGSYNAYTQTADWTVTVNASGRDLSGYVLNDTLGGQALSGPITIKSSSGAVLDSAASSFPYTFPAAGSWGSFSPTDSYTVTYSTAVPTTDGTVTNNAQLTGEGISYVASNSVNVVHASGSIAKTWLDESVEANGMAETWRAVITLPETGLAAGNTVTYTDTINNATAADGTDLGADSHYAIASELEASLHSSLDSNSSVSWSATYYDTAGQTVSATDSTTQVKSFTVVLTAVSTLGSNQQIPLTYRTYFAASAADKGGELTVTNTGNAFDHDSTASHTDTSSSLDKQGGTKTSSGISYTSGDSAVNYDDAAGILYYRILVHTDAKTTGDIVLTDALPDGTTLVSDSVSATFYESEYYSHPSDYAGYDLSQGQAPTTAVGTGSDGQSELTITIPDGYNATCGSSYRTIAVYYRLSIADDSFWNSLSNTDKTYTNTVRWGSVSSDQSTSVHHDVPNVSKNGEQLTDSDGKVTNTVKYAVTINPAGSDLAVGSDTITLTDTLNIGTAVGASLQLETLKLYSYDPTKANGLGTEIASGRYTFTYDETKNKITAVLPDSTPCVLVYQYSIDRGTVAGDISLGNSVSLAGSVTSSTKNNVSLKDSTSSATAYNDKVTVYKVDAEDYSKHLSDAVFQLDSYQKETGSWTSVGSYTTAADGTISIMHSDLTEDLLYRLTESAAPSGYTKSTESYYFVLLTPGQTKTAAINTMTQAAFNGVSTDSVRFFSSSGAIYVPNINTSLSVSKFWTDQTGASVAPAADSVTVDLYQQARKLDGYTVTVDVTTRNGTSTNSLLVAKNSPLTVTLGNLWPGLTFSVDGSNFTSTGGTLTVWHSDAVTGDCTVTITGDNNSWLTPSIIFSDNSNPTTYTSVGDATIYQTVTLSAATNWGYAWNDLPPTDASGNSYVYWVAEHEVNGCTVSYTNNAGIRTGDITVTNNVEAAYVLPETGGPGALPFELCGAFLLATSALIGLRGQKKKQRGESGLH
jgi:hypothetical protein